MRYKCTNHFSWNGTPLSFELLRGSFQSSAAEKLQLRPVARSVRKTGYYRPASFIGSPKVSFSTFLGDRGTAPAGKMLQPARGKKCSGGRARESGRICRRRSGREGLSSAGFMAFGCCNSLTCKLLQRGGVPAGKTGSHPGPAWSGFWYATCTNVGCTSFPESPRPRELLRGSPGCRAYEVAAS